MLLCHVLSDHALLLRRWRCDGEAGVKGELDSLCPQTTLPFKEVLEISLRNHLICVAYLTLKSILMNINVKCFSIRNSTEMALKDLGPSTGPAILWCEMLSQSVSLWGLVFLTS